MDDIESNLQELSERGLFRQMRLVAGSQGPRVVCDGRAVLLLCSNNYLGLASHERLRQASTEAAAQFGTGAGASRLISGNMTAHRRLETLLAEFKHKQSALLFGSGYLANTGIIGALATRGDVVFSDAANHASIIDGCRLAEAETFVYRHRDTEHLEWAMQHLRPRCSLIVTDGVFSMDGDKAPLEEIVELARRYNARVLVDEAHATGTVGPGGRGTVAEAGLEDQVDVIVGTLGKALGTYGAYAACDEALSSYLVNHARTLIFSTALPPPIVAAATAAVELLMETPELVTRLGQNARTLRNALEEFNLCPAQTDDTPIIPLQLGTSHAALKACEHAFEQGVFAQAIRPPTVPEETCRLRLAVTASHTEKELQTAASVLSEAVDAAREAVAVESGASAT
jgi:glycine C-acetyltransferase/8-amino-7-oxononanoate synthase